MGDIRCRISRSNRPCLVCQGSMDLIEATPIYSLFNALPLCGTGSVDCLDCPTCGFSTTTADYQYLDMCTKRRLGMVFVTPSREGKDLPTGKSSNLLLDIGLENMEYECPSCQVTLSTGWQFCPHCGHSRTEPGSNRCSPPGTLIQFNSYDSTNTTTTATTTSEDIETVRLVTPTRSSES
jgi:hypothetical protein